MRGARVERRSPGFEPETVLVQTDGRNRLNLFHMKIRTLILGAILFPAAACLLAAPSVQAKGFYLAGGAGSASMVNAGCAGNIGRIPGAVVTACDDSSTALKIFGGYQLTPYLGVEAAYVEFGELLNSTVSVNGTAGNATFDADGFTFSGVLTLPVAPVFAIYGRVGFFLWNGEVVIDVPGLNNSIRDDGTSLVYGVGARLNIARNVSLGVEWERYEVGDPETTGREDAQAFWGVLRIDLMQ